MKKSLKVSAFFKYLLLFFLSAIVIFPLLWLYLLSFKEAKSVVRVPPDLSLAGLTFKNYYDLLKNPEVLRWSLNSLIIAAAVTVLNVLLATMAGYAYAKRNFPGKKQSFWAIMIMMMISGQVILLPRFILVSDLGWINKYLAMIIPACVSPMFIFLSRQFIQGIPEALIHSAKVDGANEWCIYSRIILPMCLPLVAMIGIFSFIGSWNEFLWPMLVTDKAAMRTLPVGLAQMQMINVKVQYGVMFSGAAFSSLPIVIIFVAFNNYFVKGLTVGALKG